MTQQPRNVERAVALEKVLLEGNLAVLSNEERLDYYRAVCESVGLNPLTRPFAYIAFDGKIVLYATKACAEQLRIIHDVSLSEPRIEAIDGLYVSRITATLPSGRMDSDVGVVVAPVHLGSKADAMMKCVTKSKRRCTLSIIGLNVLDEDDAREHGQAVVVDDAGRIQSVASAPPVAEVSGVTPVVERAPLTERITNAAQERAALIERITSLHAAAKRRDPKYRATEAWQTHVGAYDPDTAPVELLNDLVRYLEGKVEVKP